MSFLIFVRSFFGTAAKISDAAAASAKTEIPSCEPSIRAATPAIPEKTAAQTICPYFEKMPAARPHIP